MACGCVSNSAYVKAANDQADAIKKAATIEVSLSVAALAAQTLLAGKVFKLQKEIADRQMKIAKDIHNHAKEFWPEEKALVDDAFAEAKHVADYNRTTPIWSDIMSDTMDRSMRRWIDEAKTNCTPPRACDYARWNRFSQLGDADVSSFGYRVEEARADILNDRRYGRQYAVLGMGRGLMMQVASYYQLAGATRMSNGQMLSETINSGIAAVGYYMNREKPVAWTPPSNTGFEFRLPTRGVAEQKNEMPIASPAPRSRVQGIPLQPLGAAPETQKDYMHPDTVEWMERIERMN